jgi:hypothetical protein
MSKRLLISGYRGCWNLNVISEEIEKAIAGPNRDDAVLILGDCPTGVDKVATDYAIKQNLEAVIYEADWSVGRGGGPIRNREMIVDGKPDFGLLFMSPKSKGTKNMKDQLQQFKVPFKIINV